MFIFLFCKFIKCGFTLKYDVKVYSISQKSLYLLGYMVECSCLVVNDGQIWVNDEFLDFKVISARKIGNYSVNVRLIGFRERQFCSSVFNVTYRVSSMNSRNVVAVYNITVVYSNKRRWQNAFKMF
jgi:hypothetical protein